MTVNDRSQLAFLRSLLLILWCACGAFVPCRILGQDGAAKPLATKPGGEHGAAIQRPRMFDVNAIDRMENPCDDFYEYACGSWLKANPIPPDQVFWARYNQLAEYNREVLRKILEQAAVISPART